MPRTRSSHLLAAVAGGLAALCLSLGVLPAFSEVPAIAARQRQERTDFTDAEIIEGFMQTAFGAEYHVAGRIDRIRKFDKPVKVFIAGTARPDRRRQVAGITADIGRRIQHIDITMTKTRAEANVVVNLVREHDLDKAILRFYGAEEAREIRKSLDPQCLSGFRKNENYEIDHSEVILTADSDDFVFLDCAYEELLQSLGPINDTEQVPWTMFNDNVSMGFFDIYDQYLLNILYDPRIKAGMGVAEVRAVLPGVLADVRAWIRKTNNLKP